MALACSKDRSFVLILATSCVAHCTHSSLMSRVGVFRWISCFCFAVALIILYIFRNVDEVAADFRPSVRVSEAGNAVEGGILFGIHSQLHIACTFCAHGTAMVVAPGNICVDQVFLIL